MKRFSSMIKIAGIFSFVLLLAATATFGQQVTGTILGRVTDSSGAAVPAASVQIQNTDTGLSRTDAADVDGRYYESSLPLGSYTVTVQKEGFQTLVRSGIVLSVGSQVTVNAELVVGNVQQHVEVTGEAPAIETSNATVSGLVNPDQMRSLPLNGRDIQQLALLSPGVMNNPYTSATTGASSLGSGIKISVDGGRRDATLFLLDGTTVNDQQNGGPASVAGVALGVDGILEFRVLTHDYSAEYGKKAGAVVSEVTRSGTNQWHGSAFEFVRNNIWDPRTWNNIDSAGNPIPLPEFRRNQFGGSGGGPIVKDKLFFFANYEGLRQRQGNSITVYVPNACLRAQAMAYNSPTVPYLALWGPPPANDTSLANNPQCSVAGSTQIPLGMPGSAFGDDTGTPVTSSIPTPTREDYNMMRADYKISDKDSLYVRYVYDPASNNVPAGIPNYSTYGSTTNDFFTASETHIFSQSELNEFHFGFNRSIPYSALEEPSPSAATPAFAPGQLLGGLSTTIGTTVGGAATITALGPQNPGCCFRGTQNVIQETDTFSKVVGPHSFKFGVDIERIQLNIVSSTSITGFFAFTSPFQLEGAPNNPPAKFTVLLPPSTIDRAWRHTDFGVFVQDDWRISNKLTVNLGLREEFMSSPVEENGRVAEIPNLNFASISTANLEVMPHPFTTHKFNWSPRVGLAWDPTGSGKTSIRAGGGIFYSFLDGRTFYFGAERNAIFSHAVSVTNPTFYNASLANPYQAAYQQAVAGGPSAPLNTYAWPANPPEPTVIQYNLDIQRQLGHGVSLDVGYVGSVGYHLPDQEELNLNTPCVAVTATCLVAPTPTQPTFPFKSPVKLNPAFSDIFELTSVGRYNYNGLQTTVQKSLASGLQFQASYTYGRSMSNSDEYTNGELTNSASTVLNMYNLKEDWSRSAFDQKHRLVANASYEIPFAKHMSDGIAKKFLDGWGLNGIVTVASGIPFDILSGLNQANNGDSFTTDRPNLAGSFTSVPDSGVIATSCGPVTVSPQHPSGFLFPAGTPLGTASQWFNPCALTAQTKGTYGDIERNAGTGPKYVDTDMAFVKNTALTERFKLEFRVEFFNIFNKAQLGLPIPSVFASTNATTGAANTQVYANNAGQITANIGPNREMQLGARLTF